MKELINEYKLWVKENQNFIEHIKTHDSSLYTRIMPIYEVLNFLYGEYLKDQKNIDKEIHKIFQVGFEYLHSQIFTSKVYLEKTFDNDFHNFLEYNSIIGYLLYIEDLRYELKEHNLSSDNQIINDLVIYLENLMTNKDDIPENINLYVDTEVHKLIDGSLDFHSIIDIFVEIAETLGIDLYYETDYIIGKELKNE
ncbi:MAG: hypothetical protein KAH13_00345 [Tenericutes bacterium]|nr:hypothetical protein [Mycoplasmatota bacterium]